MCLIGLDGFSAHGALTFCSKRPADADASWQLRSNENGLRGEIDTAKDLFIGPQRKLELLPLREFQE